MRKNIDCRKILLEKNISLKGKLLGKIQNNKKQSLQLEEKTIMTVRKLFLLDKIYAAIRKKKMGKKHKYKKSLDYLFTKFLLHI